LRTILTAAGLLAASLLSAQPPKTAPAPQATILDQPDARRTREELSRLFQHYPPELRNVLALDPSLLANQTYLAPYPALTSFLNAHPEIARNPSYYVGESFRRLDPPSPNDIGRQILGGLGAFAGFGMAIGLLVWLIRTLVDYRRWVRLAKVQTDVHTKILDRFTANDDLMAYIQSPAGSSFLQSSPINLDAGPRSVGAPLGRILWSVQAGVVLVAAGLGLWAISARVSGDAAQPLHALGILAIALGVGFVISAIISFVISHRLGLIEPAVPKTRPDRP
jgi:hypothetical protein